MVEQSLGVTGGSQGLTVSRESWGGGGARAGGPDPREGEAPDPEPSGSVRAEGKVLTWEHSSAQALSTKVSIPSARSGGREGVDGAFLA